jgi:hypothetical protein
MPRFTIDAYIRDQVLEAYRSLDEPNYEDSPVGGSLHRQALTIHENIQKRRQKAQQEELQLYYEIGERWYQEVEEILDL